ncbi:hypothetical protein VP01_697g1 [Puccinia sorghi]|uniref:Uncharacterized protein n=1 Tax=Puccinia sorghi TaxID=27349 RepID=A0A0L6UET2_9BASI|nr:hypothetical protein VP01_697g1 [Puccinia sorghi]
MCVQIYPLVGGDDCVLKVWDARAPLIRPVLSNSQWVARLTYLSQCVYLSK